MDDESSTSMSNVTMRGIQRSIQKWMEYTKEIERIRNKGLEAKTDDTARVTFRGMAKKLDRIFTLCLDKWNECEEMSANYTDNKFPSQRERDLQQKATDFYYEAVGLSEELFVSPPPASTSTFAPANITVSCDHRGPKLRELQLRTFKGDLGSWPTFKQQFTANVINEPSFADIDKFNYLLEYVDGSAHRAIRHIAILGENFQQAWDVLTAIYDDKRKLAQLYIERLLKFKPHQGPATFSSLQNFLSDVSESIVSLINLNIPNFSEYLLCELALRGLDQKTKEQFESHSAKTDFPSFDVLKCFLQERMKVLNRQQKPDEFEDKAFKPKAPVPTTPKPHRLNTTSFSHHSLQASTPPRRSAPGNQRLHLSPTGRSPVTCCVCQSNHVLSACDRFKRASPSQRMEMIRQANCCWNCLHPSHRVAQCPSTQRCRECGSRHHTMLHLKRSSGSAGEPSSQSPAASSAPTTSPETPKVTMSCTSSLDPASTYHTKTSRVTQPSGVILGTVRVPLRSAKGAILECRGLLDPGSQLSFITEQLAADLGIPIEPYNGRVIGINQAPLTSVKGRLRLELCPKSGPTITTSAVVVPTITSSLPQYPLPDDLWNEYNKFDLSDPHFYKPGPISVLIGVDLFPYLITGPPLEVSEMGPRLLNSVLGYVVMGRFNYIPSSEPQKSRSSVLCCHATQDYTPEATESLHQLMERFWTVEDVQPSSELQSSTSSTHPLAPEELECETFFQTTHYRNPDGRYVVRLPFRNNMPSLSLSSKHLGLKRFYSMEAKMNKHPQLRKEYHDFMSAYLDLGHMSPAQDSGDYLIPHHAVFRVCDDTLTKFRVVFDGSSSTKQGAINDYLHTGPKLQKDIGDIVLRFRRFKFALTCDIVKMFRQILIHPLDRKFQHIAWRYSPEDPISYYVLNTVTYGLRPSPYLALRVINQLVLDEGHNFPLAAQALRESIYVDDICTGANSEEELETLKNQLIELLGKACLPLSKWNSNHIPFLRSIDPNPEPSVSLCPLEASTTKILGMQWDPIRDSFSYQLSPLAKGCSKRIILSNIARLFDPLGYLAPVVFFAKCILQETWKISPALSWDQDVPDDLKSSWSQFTSEFHHLSEIQIPRFIKPSSKYQLIGFCDASTRGYCAVVYLRSSGNESPRLTLIKAKTKLAPIKTLTIPRLELSAALLLAQTLKSLSAIRDHYEIHQVFCFSDSTTVLAWLNTPSYKLKVFVANRVEQILKATETSWWNYINTKDNPADVGSRGILPSALRNHSLWWTGPSWCCKDITEWPVQASILETEVPELKTFAVISPGEEPFINFINKFSKYNKTIRIMAYISRITSRAPKANLCITAEEFHQAEKICIRLTQQLHLSSIPCSWKSLNAYWDPEGICRVGGRLANAPLPVDHKHQILLPKQAHLSILLIDHIHESNHHLGVNSLLAILQQRFWIPGARDLLKKKTRSCITCIRYAKAATNSPIMGHLPASRFTSVRAFFHTGVDFAGPFLCRESSRRKACTVKSYLCLFVCMSTKAVHLELATSLSTEEFLNAFDRFTARRGLPACMHSDCGTNFVGAARYLEEVTSWLQQPKTQSEICSRTAPQKVEWRFNPPSAPHFGGLWEAGVKSVKALLHRTVGAASFTVQELNNMFTKIEAILNSRPIQPLSSDPHDLEPLTPGHFLIGHPLNALPELDLQHLPENRLSRWQLIRERVQFFWKRWMLEYLSTLQRRSKWQRPVPGVNVGDLVLLKSSESAPMHWPMARILETHPGNDGVVRVVTLRTNTGVYKRPTVNLVPLISADTDPSSSCSERKFPGSMSGTPNLI